MANLSRRVVLLAMLGLLFIGSSPVVRAGVTLTVNTTVDAVDALPGDGLCETAPGNQTCTLRAAVQETNAQPGPDTISVPPGIYTFTIASDGDEDPRFGDLDVFDDLVVNGSGAAATIIDGNQLDRVFDVPGAGYTLTLNRITVRNGRAAGYSYNDGGGVRNVGSLIVNDSIFSGNSADEGGAIFNFSGVVVTNSIFSQNTAYTGGAIYNNGGGVTILNNTISDNTAVDGGGITNGGIMRINRSTISGNTATQGNGGILNGGLLYLLNTTVSGNSGVAGGGIGNAGNVVLSSSTVVSNTASQRGGGLYNFTGFSSGASYLQNSIIAGNSAPAGQGADCAGTRHNSLGYNLLQNIAGCTLIGDLRGNIIGRDARLGPLQDNGGPTHTHALLSDSPAIDAANPTGCTDADGNYITEDQRDAIRPRDGNGDGRFFWDIGAFEFGAEPPARTAEPSPAPASTPTPTATPTPTTTAAPPPTIGALGAPHPTLTPTATPVPATGPRNPSAPRQAIYMPLLIDSH